MIKIYDFHSVSADEIFARVEPTSHVSDIVSDIIAQVRKNGDSTLFELCKKFDGATLKTLRVSQEEMRHARELVGEEFLAVLEKAAANIREFHKKQAQTGFEIKREDGSIVGQKIMPIEKVGLYVPGGTAAYPSTVLMDALPAKIAGCEKIVMVTPPCADGSINPHILAAAHVAQIDEIYKVGGAQAIAALAYGTESIPRVYKIVGPGNAFVAEAKRQVFGQVNIDMIAGPSEILVIADSKQPAHVIAADLLSQAEHDKLASAVLVCDSHKLALSVQEELEKQLLELPREEIARASIENNGKIIVCSNLDEVIDVANEIAPEHLELCLDNPNAYLDRIKNAGSIFMGRMCPEALGDYFAGPNHTLPTSGTARFASPLGVDDFIKKSQYLYYTKEALDTVAEDVAMFAHTEGLDAHAKSALVRSK